MTTRPDFLTRHMTARTSGADLIAAFGRLSPSEAREVDRWFVANLNAGKTWQEVCLLAALNDGRFEDLLEAA